MSQPVTAILIGAGNRGYEAYGPYALAHPNEIRFVAVAEPHATDSTEAEHASRRRLGRRLRQDHVLVTVVQRASCR